MGDVRNRQLSVQVEEKVKLRCGDERPNIFHDSTRDPKIEILRRNRRSSLQNFSLGDRPVGDLLQVADQSSGETSGMNSRIKKIDKKVDRRGEDVGFGRNFDSPLSELEGSEEH